jgi:tetratricopeptide (TPR) repeat protein
LEAKQNNLKKEAGAILNNLANLSNLKGNFAKSFDYLNQCSEIGKSLQDTLLIMASLNGLGEIYRKKGQADSALNMFLNVEKLADGSKNMPILLATKINIAAIYFLSNRFDKIDESELLQTMELADNLGDNINKASILQMLGGSKLKQKDFEKALEYLNSGLQVMEESGSSTSVKVYLIQGVGNVYYQLGQYEKAIKYNSDGIILAEKIELNSILPLLYGNNASNYLELKNFSESIKNSLKAISYSLNLDLEEDKYQPYGYLAKAYAGIGSYQKAYEAEAEYNKLYSNYRDKAQSKQVSEIEIKYETEKKDTEIKLLSKQTEIQTLKLLQQRYFLGGLAMLILFIIGGSIFVYRQRRFKQKQAIIKLELEETRKRLEMEKQLKASEITAIKAQMNPHFIFNAINSIQDLILKGDIDNSYSYIIKFAQLVRQTLNYSDKEFIDVEDEIQLLEVYLELEKLRFKNDFEYIINKNNLTDFQIPPMLIQPFVENAIKHGLLHKDGLKKLEISLTKDDLFRCTISDNGVGRKMAQEIKERQHKNYESFSVNATRNRFEIMKENYNQDLGVEYTDLVVNGESIGTKVQINMPFKQNY